MESGVKRSQRDYTLAFKLRVVDQVEKGEFTYKEAQKFYGIQGRSTVLVWLRKHGQQGWRKIRASDFKGNVMVGRSQTPLSPEQRIKALEVQLKEANEKAKLFEAMLDVLRKDYGVKVTKKPSGKSSRVASSKA